jgi:S1-C subfamily serine protease
MEFEEISSFYQLYYRIPQGLYITQVAEGSDAAAKGIAAGDILLQLDNTRITDASTLETLLYSHEAGDSVIAYLYRNGQQYSVTLTLDESQ